MKPFISMAALAAAVAVALGMVGPAAAVTLPGLSYEILNAGPGDGPHPTRADSVTMRYVGRLADGQVFSTSPGDGAQAAVFPVNGLIPGMTAALQLMRPGDRWRIVMPPYLAYGPGRPYTPPASANTPATQRRSIPADATLTFDVELTGIVAKPAPTP